MYVFLLVNLVDPRNNGNTNYWNILRHFKAGTLIHIDFEGTKDYSRDSH